MAAPNFEPIEEDNFPKGRIWLLLIFHGCSAFPVGWRRQLHLDR